MPNMNSNVLANDKHFAAKHAHQLQYVKPTPESVVVVTFCLSSCEECNGGYEDNTGKFKIQCHCLCHGDYESTVYDLEDLQSIPAHGKGKPHKLS